MSSALPCRARRRTFLLWAAPLSVLGCGGGGTDVVLPSLSVSTSTQGVELDPDGYNLIIDGSENQPVGVSATIVIERLSEGEHVIELGGLAGNCSAGNNPRTVSVRAGATATATFAVTCSATSGSVEVATVTTGGGSDPDGFLLTLDGGERGAIGTSATLNLAGVSPGLHSVGLSGLAGNCQVAGENPRQITVVSGQTVQVPFTVTCVPPGAGTGTLEITTTTSGSDPDADGYSVSVDGAASQPIGANARLTLSNIPSGARRVDLHGIAANCSLAVPNPHRVTVTAGGTATVAFAVNCAARPPETGAVRVSVSTSGSSQDPDGYTVSVDGGSGQSIGVNGSRTIQAVTLGQHSVELGGIAANCTVAGENPRSVTVTAGQTATLSFTVSCVATSPSVNLRIERMYLTQSTQTPDGSGVPLIQGRDAYLRVFVTASGSNSVRPPVRVRFFRNGASTPTQTLTIHSAGSSTPASVQEGTLGSSWNIRVPAALIQPNTAVLADVDPEDAVSESNEGDNGFPASGTPRLLTVQSVPPVAIQFVPIRQAANGLTGTAGNVNDLIDLARRMHPLNEIRTSVHSLYTTTTQLPLESTNGNEAWLRVLEEIDAMRLIEGGNQHYFGLVRVNYGAGMNGIGYVGVPSAVGSDDPAEAARVVAHELGHNWGRWHSPCGGPRDLDPDEPYPYAEGRIGVYGLDVTRERLRPPSDPDIMGYCPNPWISDHTFNRVLSFRAAAASSASLVAGKQPSMIVWGRIENGRLVLEPAFHVVTRPSLPKRPGPYTVEATAADGTRLFTFSFEANPVADTQSESRHFAFAVPLDPGRAAQVRNLRLSGPGAQLLAVAQSRGDLQRRVSPDTIVVGREVGAVTLRWDASVHPMIAVRDPDTGEVLSLARGGSARIPTGKAQVHLEVSDGVRSYGLRRAISR